MDADYSQSVMDVFVDLYKKGLIYRGKRMINWDPKAKTALSDEEVIMRETNSKLYHLKYELVNEDGSPLGETITIATVRPETILGDSAVAVNPNDARYQHLKGKKAVVPLIGRQIPIIFDEYVETDFGTGALKVTPAHDKNDDMLGQKHGLEVIDIMNDDATFSEDAQLYIGMDRFDVRKQIVIDLEAKGYLVKTEDYTNQVGYSERSDAVVEPRLSMQWWVKMEPLATPALKVVMDGEINFHPAKFKNLYQHWMTNIKDWCISRQLWWGHRIPAWYDADGTFYVAANEAEAYAQYYAAKGIEAPATHNNELTQDEDCLDTWFSSWLWPFEVFDGLRQPGNEEVKYYYPTNTLVTAPEIIFFWVARMIMAGLEYEKVIPFKDVYFTGIVRDEFGRKMSKQLGNSPDLLKMIEEHGADAVRFGILISSPAGNDLLFDVKELATVKQGSFFINKIWNAMKLVKMWEGRQSETAAEQTHFAVEWFQNRLAQAAIEIDSLMAQFRLSEALKALYTLIWDDFCSWYLEWIKPGFEQPIDKGVYNKTIEFFSELMSLLHPFVPFATEEVYHLLAERTDDITVKQWTKFEATDTAVLDKAAVLKQVITAIREARAKNQLKPKDVVTLHITTENEALYNDIAEILSKQVNADGIHFTQEAVSKTIAIAVEKDKFYIESQVELDTAAQRESLQKDLDHQKGFLNTVLKKLSNEKFVANAKPEVVAIEQKKQADAEARIKAIEESLASLG